MSALPNLYALVLAQAGGSSPGISGFWYGAGRILAILLAIVVVFVVVALIRAGKSRR